MNAKTSPPHNPTILVTGDLIIDDHIYEGARHHFGDSAPGVYVTVQTGGAGLLAGLLQNIPGLENNSFLQRQMPPEGNDNDVSHHAYAFWRPLPKDCEVEKRFWRCGEAMGFGAHNKAEISSPPCKVWPLQKGLPDKPNIIVISEGGMGFRDTKDCWSALAFDSASLIILKTAWPLAQGELWNALTDKYQSKLMVVVSADELRRSSARVSGGLSWEATFQDLMRELAPDGRLAEITRCRHLCVTFGSEGAAWFDFASREKKGRPSANEDQVCFVYQAGAIENDHALETEGTGFGFLTCVTAALARAATFSAKAGKKTGRTANPDFGSALEAGLAAMRDLREKGHGSGAEKPEGFPFRRLADVICHPNVCYTRASLPLKQARKLFAASNTSILSLTQRHAKRDGDGPAWEFARLIAIHGPVALGNLPHLGVGRFLTADRGEVESLRTLAQVFRNYDRKDEGKKPLSIGVFGPPGAGKSFAVRELAQTFLRKKPAWLEFNLSQFASPEDLNGAFHQVRDQVLQGKLPVAFFDEFDSRNYFWLQYLLAPMQDGRFQQGQLTHTLGKAIFVFAGGTSWTFNTFGPPEPKSDSPTDDPIARRFDEFRLAKGTDFKSRLDAVLNVLGPNRRTKSAPEKGAEVDFEMFGHRLVEDEADIWFPIRRALIFRTDLGLPADQQLDIDPGLLHAILRVPRYTHGSRSLSKILSPLKAALPTPLRPSNLPPPGQVAMHTHWDDFRKLCSAADVRRERKPDALGVKVVQAFAPVIHETYNQLGLRAGWLKPGEARSLTDYAEENPFQAESNFAAARRIPGILALVGLRIEKQLPAKANALTLEEDRAVRQHIEFHLELLANAEHQGWMQWHFDHGWTYHPKRDNAKCRHDCLKPFTQLKEADRAKDREQVRHFPEFAKRAGYRIEFAK